MSEKTGDVIKLEYDFDTSKNLEVYMPNLKNWYRVTSREFRSFNGKRRINEQEFIGNLYKYGTNRLVNSKDYESDKPVEMNWKSVRRPGENWD